MPKSEPASTAETTITVPQVVFDALTARAERTGTTLNNLLASLSAAGCTEVIDLEQLVKLASEPRERTFTLNGARLKIRVRALTAEESAEIDKLEGAVIAPKDKTTGMPNEEDPAYRAQLMSARKLKRAMAFEIAVISFKLKGDTLKDKADYLYTKLPPGVIDEIWRAIYELTSDPIENALFT